MIFSIGYIPIRRSLLTLLGTGPAQSSVVLDRDAVTVRMGWAFCAHIPRSSIVEARRIPDVPWAIGVHGWRGKWIANSSPRGMVELEIDPPSHARVLVFAVRLRLLDLSLEDPDAFLAKVGRGIT